MSENFNEDGDNKSQAASDFEAKSLPVKSEAIVSAVVGTSNKSSGSFRNINVLARINEDELLSGRFEGSDKKKDKDKKKDGKKSLNPESDECKNSGKNSDPHYESKQQDQQNKPEISNNQEQTTERNKGASIRSFESQVNQII